MKIDIKDISMIVGTCAFIFGMYSLVTGDLNNDLSRMIWESVLIMFWVKSTIIWEKDIKI